MSIINIFLKTWMCDMKAKICIPRLGISMFCMTIFCREEGFATVVTEGRGARRVCGRLRVSVQAVTDSLTQCWQSQRVETPCWPSAEWSEAPGPVSTTGRGGADPNPRKGEETDETSNCCPHVSDCCSCSPRGGSEDDFEDNRLTSTHTLHSGLRVGCGNREQNNDV